MSAEPATHQPPPGPIVTSEWSQSLADGAPGIALPHIERARTGITGWESVHRLAMAMTAEPVHADPEVTNLFRGAPAVAYALHTAGHPGYRTALATLDQHITRIIQIRLDAAHQRIDQQRIAQAGEYDLINGLTGFGAYLMHRHHDPDDLLRAVLEYLVRLTRPVRVHGRMLPGWWATGSPDRRRSPRWNGGHTGFGMAHGIAGPLALLSTAMRQGTIVDGHREAIATIGGWLDRWQQGQAQHAWWPEVIDYAELRADAPSSTGPERPSWCYGTPGIARAQQLAAAAAGDPERARLAEQALLGCLTDERQLAHLADAGLCHGWAGLVHTARRAATDIAASAEELATATGTAAGRMREHVRKHGAPTDGGFLEGAAGVALVEEARYDVAAVSTAGPTWDTCLLLS